MVAGSILGEVWLRLRGGPGIQIALRTNCCHSVVDYVTRWRECPGLCVMCPGMTAESPWMSLAGLETSPLDIVKTCRGWGCKYMADAFYLTIKVKLMLISPHVT